MILDIIIVLLVIAVVVIEIQINNLANSKIDKQLGIKSCSLKDYLGKYWKLIQIVSSDSYNNNIHFNYQDNLHTVKTANSTGCTLYYSDSDYHSSRFGKPSNEFLSWAQLESIDPDWCACWADLDKLEVSKTELESLKQKAKSYDLAVKEINVDLLG